MRHMGITGESWTPPHEKIYLCTPTTAQSAAPFHTINKYPHMGMNMYAHTG